METINLDMDDIFDAGHGDDDDFGAQTTLPDLDNDDEGPMRVEGEEGSQEDDEGVVANLQRLSKGAAKKRVLKPQPKLDADRLKSERGLAVLPGMFKKVKFKGKGHEAEDLKLMMGKLEHWAHRLYPAMPFDDFIERMEKMGSKKPVMNILHRIRLDMPILDDEYVAQFDDGQPTANGSDAEKDKPKDVVDMDADEAWEEMIRQERQEQESKVAKERGDSSSPHASPRRTQSRQSPPSSTQPPASTQSQNPDVGVGASQGKLSSQDDDSEGSQAAATPARNHVAGTTPSQGLTPEQRERLERNKMVALQKRAARLGVPVSALLPPQTPTRYATPSSQSPSATSSATGSDRVPTCDTLDSQPPKGEADTPSDTPDLKPGSPTSDESSGDAMDVDAPHLPGSRDDVRTNAPSPSQSLSLKLSADSGSSSEAMDEDRPEAEEDAIDDGKQDKSLSEEEMALNLHLTESDEEVTDSEKLDRNPKT